MTDLTKALQMTEAEWNQGNRLVLVGRYDSLINTRTRPVKLLKDDAGFYVRTGMRGVNKQYLRDMASARVFDTFAVFYETDD